MANTFSELIDPLVVSRDSTNNIGVTAEDFRFALVGFTTPIGNAYGAKTGVLAGRTSNNVVQDCQITAPGADMKSTINPGNLVMYRPGKGSYHGAVKSAVQLTHATADANNPRVDLVIIRYRDPGYESTTFSAMPMILQGAPSATPSAPTNLLTDGDIQLGAVTVRKAATSVIDTDVAERRTFVAARGGIRSKSTFDLLAPAYDGEYRDDPANNVLERGDQNNLWVPIASGNSWTPMTPVLYSSAGAVTWAAGSTITGSYLLLGKTLHFRYTFRSNGTTNAGYGGLYTRLPNGLFANASGYNYINAYYYITGAVTAPVSGVRVDYGIYPGLGEVSPNTNEVRLLAATTPTDNRLSYARYATAANSAGTGIPLALTAGFPNPSTIMFQGTVEVQ